MPNYNNQDEENRTIQNEINSLDETSLTSANYKIKYLKEWKDSEPVKTLADGQLRIILRNSMRELNVDLIYN